MTEYKIVFIILDEKWLFPTKSTMKGYRTECPKYYNILLIYKVIVWGFNVDIK